MPQLRPFDYAQESETLPRRYLYVRFGSFSTDSRPSALRRDGRRPILNQKPRKWRDALPRFFIASILAVVSLVVCASVAAQDYPTRPIRVIISLGAGGGGDVFARALADELSKTLHQPVIVENRPGGALNIGTRACAESAPDGYTVCVLSSEPMVYNQFAFKSLPFDPEKDFEPISLLFFQHAGARHQPFAQGADDS